MLNIIFCLVLDRDVMIIIENLNIKVICRSLKGEVEDKSLFIFYFFENEFDEFF